MTSLSCHRIRALFQRERIGSEPKDIITQTVEEVMSELKNKMINKTVFKFSKLNKSKDKSIVVLNDSSDGTDLKSNQLSKTESLSDSQSKPKIITDLEELNQKLRLQDFEKFENDFKESAKELLIVSQHLFEDKSTQLEINSSEDIKQMNEFKTIEKVSEDIEVIEQNAKTDDNYNKSSEEQSLDAIESNDRSVPDIDDNVYDESYKTEIFDSIQSSDEMNKKKSFNESSSDGSDEDFKDIIVNSLVPQIPEKPNQLNDSSSDESSLSNSSSEAEVPEEELPFRPVIAFLDPISKVKRFKRLPLKLGLNKNKLKRVKSLHQNLNF